MRFSYQITLPREAFDQFQKRLETSISNEKRNAFLEEINKDIHVTYKGPEILVEASNLNEASIMAKLVKQRDKAIQSIRYDKSFFLRTSSVIDTEEVYNLLDRDTVEDRYIRLLRECAHMHTSYNTADVQDNLKSA